MQIASISGDDRVAVSKMASLWPSSGDCYFGASFNSLLVGGVFGLIEAVPLSVRT
jgi:hypothetical protein